MNTMDEHDERLLDWGLEDRLGGEAPPDLLAAVRARLAVGEVAPARLGGSWPLAALLLLGIAAVVAVAWWGRPTAPAPAQEPPPVPVSTLAEIQALPGSTRAVELTNVDDEAFAALARLRELELLIVREPLHENYGLGLKVTMPPGQRHLTAACWRTIPGFTKLRRLELSGVLRIGRLDAAGIDPQQLGSRLAALPLLESLTLRFLDLDDAALAMLQQLTSLRRLDLSFNHGFDDAGLDHVLRCRSLRVLSLRGCQQLSGEALARLVALPELEELDLSLIDGINWRNHGGWLDDTEREVVLRAQQAARVRGRGVRDATLVALAGSRTLRKLDITGADQVSAAGLAGLGDCASLRELGAFGVPAVDPSWVAALPQLERLEVCGDFTDAFCDAVRGHLLHLRRLSVAACYQITDRGLATLLAMPSLRALDMGQMYGLTVACLDAVATATQLEELDLRNNDFVTAREVVRLRRALPNLRVLQTSLPAAEIDALERLPAAEPTRPGGK